MTLADRGSRFFRTRREQRAEATHGETEFACVLTRTNIWSNQSSVSCCLGQHVQVKGHLWLSNLLEEDEEQHPLIRC